MIAYCAKLRKLREDRGLQQKDLARLAGCSRSHLCYLEMGSKAPSLSIGLRIAKALGVSADHFADCIFPQRRRHAAIAR
jgi:transcriptional regulator with XRE-family HTH domain